MNASQDTILALVKELTQNDQITMSQTLLDEGLIDSLTTIELITKLEEQFNINIDTDDLNHHNFNSVENITTLVNQKLPK